MAVGARFLAPPREVAVCAPPTPAIAGVKGSHPRLRKGETLRASQALKAERAEPRWGRPRQLGAPASENSLNVFSSVPELRGQLRIGIHGVCESWHASWFASVADQIANAGRLCREHCGPCRRRNRSGAFPKGYPGCRPWTLDPALLGSSGRVGPRRLLGRTGPSCWRAPRPEKLAAGWKARWHCAAIGWSAASCALDLGQIPAGSHSV